MLSSEQRLSCRKLEYMACLADVGGKSCRWGLRMLFMLPAIEKALEYVQASRGAA